MRKQTKKKYYTLYLFVWNETNQPNNVIQKKKKNMKSWQREKKSQCDQKLITSLR